MSLSPNSGRFQYTGQAWLPEVGLYYYKARIYSPTLGRFLQTDPVGYDDQVNLYAYVGNDPVNVVDSTGLEAGSCYGSSGWSCGMGTSDDRTAGEKIGDAIFAISILIDLVDSEISPGPDAAILGAEIRSSFRAGAKKVERRAAPVAKKQQESGIIYRRTNRETGRCYIGRCNSEALYKRRQRDHSRRNPDADYEFEAIERVQPGRNLREAEQRQIEAHGGPTNKSNPQGGTENKRNEISPCRGTRIGNGDGRIC